MRQVLACADMAIMLLCLGAGIAGLFAGLLWLGLAAIVMAVFVGVIFIIDLRSYRQ